MAQDGYGSHGQDQIHSSNLYDDAHHVPQQSRREKLRYDLNPNNFGICTTTTNPRQQLGPFTGYAEILSRSRFLGPARELLEEACHVAGAVDRIAGDVTRGGMGEEGQQQWRSSSSRLESMLDEVYRRYKLYYQQVQVVLTSFESVPGLSTASPYASMALKVMSKHFRSLKNAISDQLNHANKGSIGEESISGVGLLNRLGNYNYENVMTRQPQVWRPQRGLPERAVAVLRAWLFEHFLHPYPTDMDKQILAKHSGLTRNQVSNWFINARVRLWKPMVEEVHSLELRQQNKTEANTNHKQSQLPSSSSAATSTNDQNQSLKRSHDELMQIPNQIDQEPNYSNNLVYDAYSGHHKKGSADVSLTLGLHQNNGICFREPIIPMNVVRQFGLGIEECSDPYVIGLFGKEIGGHFLHDFVG